LLPSLTVKNMQAEVFDRQESFQEVDQRITHSMLFFLQAPTAQADEADMLRLQTEKCYRKIPRYFF
jgi:hypothetical protein